MCCSGKIFTAIKSNVTVINLVLGCRNITKDINLKKYEFATK